MEQVPRCPRCGVEVQPHWDRCEECGYSHHDDPEPDAVDHPPSAAVAAPGFFDAPAPGSIGATSTPSRSAGDPTDEPVSFDLPPYDEADEALGAHAAADAPLPPPPPPPPPAFEAGPPPPAFDSGPFVHDGPSSGADPEPPPPMADPLSRWEEQATVSATGSGLSETGADDAGASGRRGGPDAPPRSGKRITAADGARSASSFQLNKVVVGVALVLAALVLVWQASSLLSSDSGTASAPTGSTVPPLGAIATTTTPATTPDGVIITPVEETTTTVDTLPKCDSSTSVYSADGKGYRPCGGAFQIDLPGRADVRTSTSETAVGPVRWTSLTSTDNTQDPWVRSVIVYGDLPRELTPEEIPSTQEALVAQVFASPGEVTTFQDLPALTFTGTDANGDEIMGIAFVSGTKAYAIAAKSPGSPEAGYQLLHDSFVFL